MTRAILWTAVSSLAQAEDEKASLPAQEADLRALAEKKGWEIVDVLVVPGHSRRYVDWHKLVRDGLNSGVDAFAKLDAHFQRGDFDVLAVRDADRFARTQTLTSFIVESTINVGATIYSLADGEVDERNYRMFISMAGYRAAGQVDQLVKYRDMAMNVRAEQGLPVSGLAFWSHRIIRDERGKAIGYVVDESKRRAFDDLAELLLTGMGWEGITKEMTQRGHVTSGKTFEWYRRVLNPTWWGHAARHFDNMYGAWVYDVDAPVPDGVSVWRNVYPSVWTGEMKEAVIAELKRRHSGRSGRRYPGQSRRFAGLLVCAYCGRSMTASGGRQEHAVLGYKCQWSRRDLCDTKNYVNEPAITAHVTALLRAIKKGADPDAVFTQGPLKDPKQALEAARAELDKTREQARAMSRLYATSTGTPLADVYMEELRQLEDRAIRLQGVINRERDAASRAAPQKRVIRDLDIDNLWSKSDQVINQTLHRIFGQWRLVVQDGKVVGYLRAPRVSRKVSKSLDTLHHDEWYENYLDEDE
jgi:DNA invertase Pin-like site-specific DNA recombinase